MEVRAEVLERSLRKMNYVSNLISIVVGIIAATSIGFGFYYNTKSTLDSHGKSIDTLEKDVKLNNKILNDIQVYKGVSSSEMQNLEKKVDKIDEKLDKLLLLQKN